jgi:hypothetical protein
VPNTEFVPALPIFGLAHPALAAPPAPTVIAYVPKLNSCADP